MILQWLGTFKILKTRQSIIHINERDNRRDRRPCFGVNTASVSSGVASVDNGQFSR